MLEDSESTGQHGANGAPVPPEVLAAEEQVRQAREELRNAQKHLDALWREAALEDSPRSNASVVFDDVLKLARKYPLPSLAVAVSIGFFVGRLFRR